MGIRLYPDNWQPLCTTVSQQKCQLSGNSRLPLMVSVQRCTTLTQKKCQLSGGQLPGYNCRLPCKNQIWAIYNRSREKYSTKLSLKKGDLGRILFPRKIIKSLLALQLIEIIKENELDYHPLIVHVIGSDGAMIYAKMHRLMQHYIHGAIIESLPAESSPNNLVKSLFKALIWLLNSRLLLAQYMSFNRKWTRT